MSYRTELPFIAVAHRDDRHAAVTLPSGKLIRFIGPAEDDRFLVIEIDGEQFRSGPEESRPRSRGAPPGAGLSASASM